MIRPFRLMLTMLGLMFMSVVGAADLASLTAGESADGLRAALNQAAAAAISELGRADGFFNNPEVKIPLPGKLEKARKTLRKLGLSKQVDALDLAMNRAAEAAVPEARELFVQSIRQMSVTDALGIIRGSESAATAYFRKSMSDKLTAKFMPIIGKATANEELAQKYNAVAKKAQALGLVDDNDASLDAYVTRKALDGLFLVMSKEELAIRKDPAGQASALLRKVFGGQP